MRWIQRAFFGLSVLLFIFLLGFILDINIFFSQLAESLYPGSGVVLQFSLLVTECIALVACAAIWWLQPPRLMLHPKPTEQERIIFAKELERRLRKHPLIRKAQQENSCPPSSDAQFLLSALAILDAAADDEIRSTGKKVFIATAISQNGRLDALIMFFVLLRLVRRIARIYNQRPRLTEMASVYTTVATAVFIAFAMDELDVAGTISASMGNLLQSSAPAMAVNSIPFVGSTVQVFTNSAIEGAANSYLSIRAGLAVRKAFHHNSTGGEFSPLSLYAEAGKVLSSISCEAIANISTCLRKHITSLPITAGSKAFSLGKNLLRG